MNFWTHFDILTEENQKRRWLFHFSAWDFYLELYCAWLAFVVFFWVVVLVFGYVKKLPGLILWYAASAFLSHLRWYLWPCTLPTKASKWPSFRCFSDRSFWTWIGRKKQHSISFSTPFFHFFHFSVVVDISLYVVIPSRRSSAEAFQLMASHALGEAGSPYLTGLISDAFQDNLGNSSFSNCKYFIKIFIFPNFPSLSILPRFSIFFR